MFHSQSHAVAQSTQYVNHTLGVPAVTWLRGLNRNLTLVRKRELKEFLTRKIGVNCQDEPRPNYCFSGAQAPARNIFDKRDEARLLLRRKNACKKYLWRLVCRDEPRTTPEKVQLRSHAFTGLELGFLGLAPPSETIPLLPPLPADVLYGRQHNRVINIQFDHHHLTRTNRK